MKITKSYEQLWLHDDDGNQWNVAEVLMSVIDDRPLAPDKPTIITITANVNGVPVDVDVLSDG